jgi:dihydroorotate dehydrogenase electron transfer subunit
MSVAPASEGFSSIVVKAMGEGSRALFNCKEDDLLGIRGPYGNGFVIPEGTRKVLLVGGGTGISPILNLAEKIYGMVDADVVIGAKTRNEIPFVTKLKDLLGEEKVFPTTDDGSYGFKGYAHHQVLSLVKEQDYDLVCCCGPEVMMLQVFKICEGNRIAGQFSLERIMKCGIAICGSCGIEDLVLCRDGPVLDIQTLKRSSKEFGKSERDKTGALVKKF